MACLRIHGRFRSETNAQRSVLPFGAGTPETGHGPAASASSPYRHGYRDTPRFPSGLSARGQMDHRDSTAAGRHGGQDSTDAAGIAGRSDSDRLHCLVEYRQSPSGAHIGTAAGDGYAVGPGASRGRMVRQMLTESLLLSILGGSAGIALTIATLKFMPRFIP